MCMHVRMCGFISYINASCLCIKHLYVCVCVCVCVCVRVCVCDGDCVDRSYVCMGVFHAYMHM